MTHRRLLLVLVLIGMSVDAYGKPPSLELNDEIVALRDVAKRLRTGAIGEADRVILKSAIGSGHPVLVSAAAWLVGEFANSADPLFPWLSSFAHTDDMTSAFTRIAIEKVEARKRGQPWHPRKETDNPYYFVEATRFLMRESPEEGRRALKEMQASGSSTMKDVARRMLILTNRDDKARRTDVRLALNYHDYYEVVTSIIKEAEPGPHVP